MSTDFSTRKRPANRFERAKQLAAEGYTLSENIYAAGLYSVHKPNGTVYIVDAERQTCTCPATVRDCSHWLFVQTCLRFAATLERRTVTTTPKRQPRIGARRHKALANLLTLTTTPTVPDPLRQTVVQAMNALKAANAARSGNSFAASMRLEDEYVAKLGEVAAVGKYNWLDVQRAIEWGRGGCADVLAIVAEICAAKAAAERRRAA